MNDWPENMFEAGIAKRGLPGPRTVASEPVNPFSIQMRYELEMISDAFEDALSERSFVGVAGVIDRLQAWRAKYGMKHEPFEGSA